MTMHYAVCCTGLGLYSEPEVVLRLAETAEAAGWEGLFLWDHLNVPGPWITTSTDPWIALAAVAARTDRLVLGTAVTPLPRHPPHVLARTLTALDRLSRGRVVLGAGLGGPPESPRGEFRHYGLSAGARVLGEMVDESLGVLTSLFSGAEVNHQGPHYTVDGVTLGPLPVQEPRIPVWIGGSSGPALRRAARWDGWVIGGDDETGANDHDV